MLLSPLGFLDVIYLLSDFWLHHLGCEATPEKVWCLSAWLCRKTCSCSWTSNCIIKTLACWLYPGWLLCVCEGWQVPAGDEQCFQAGSISCWWLPGQQPGLMVCLVSKEVQICDRSVRVIEKWQSWYHHKKVEAASLYFVPEISGEFGLAQKPWDLQAWNEMQLPCRFYSFKYRHH